MDEEGLADGEAWSAASSMATCLPTATPVVVNVSSVATGTADDEDDDDEDEPDEQASAPAVAADRLTSAPPPPPPPLSRPSMASTSSRWLIDSVSLLLRSLCASLSPLAASAPLIANCLDCSAAAATLSVDDKVSKVA